MTTTDHRFQYSEMIGRNLGFVTAKEQERLRDGSVFVCGVGGMGGACLMSLARAGLGRVIVADLDTFELSNLNRQLFADLDSVDQPKVDATVRQLRLLNPKMEIETHGGDWVDHLDGILGRAPVVINGMDDIPCGIHLYRRARACGATVIDAYTSPLPSVTVVAPGDPRPEERLGFPSAGKDWRALDENDVAGSMRCELEYVMTHSSSRHHVDLDVAAEMVRGDRPRMSFAPMVITTGSLMAFEAVNLLLERPSGTDCRGYFFNPWKVRVERPRNPVSAALMGFVVRRFLDRFIDAD